MWKRKKELPRKIAETVKKLKTEYGVYIAARKINGRYYLYKEWKVRDDSTNKQRLKAEYLGKITGEGIFQKSASKSKLNLESATRFIENLGGKITMPEPAGDTHGKELDSVDDKLLTCLSMNARLPVPKIARLSNLNEQTAYSRIRSLEKKLNINYISEINASALGYTTYLLLIKFEDAPPTLQELRETIILNPRIQFAAELKGEYDLVMFILDEGPIKAEDSLWEFRSTTTLGNYKAIWHLIPFGCSYSFIPLRTEFIERVLINKLWKRGKERGIFSEVKLKQREYFVLKELNNNSIEDFAVIDRKYHLGSGSSRYAYQKLTEGSVIVRPTITVSLPMKYLSMILLETVNASEARETRSTLLLNVIETGSICSKYSLCGNTGSPEGSVLFMPVMNSEDLDKEIGYLQKSIKGIRFRTLIVTNVIIGSLCYRRFDNRYSRQYEILAGLKEIEPEVPINYSQQG